MCIPARESRAKIGSSNLMIGTKKKQHRTVEITDPNLGGASVEKECAFFVDFGWRIRSGENLDAERRSRGERGCWISEEPAFLSGGEQDDIGDPNLCVASKNGLLDRGELAGVNVIQEVGDNASSLAMIKARRGRHDELASGVDLEAFGPIGEGGIGADLEPASSGRGVG
jgi:hypothetical protein